MHSANENSFWRRALRNRQVFLGSLVLTVVCIMSLVSLFWTPYSILEQDISRRLLAPNASHFLGTDQYGRDLLSMLMVGGRASLSVAFAALIIGAGIGIPIGCLAASGHRWLSEILMRVSDFIFAFPSLLLALLLTSVYGFNFFNAVIAIGIFNIPVFARIAHGASLSVLHKEFVLAARVAGKGLVRISFEHVLPNIMNLLIVQATIQFSLGILIEAGLSYVGVGTQPPMSSWGRMLADSQTLIGLAPHLALVPGLAIVITVWGLNLMGDGLRDLLDPKLNRVGRVSG